MRRERRSKGAIIIFIAAGLIGAGMRDRSFSLSAEREGRAGQMAGAGDNLQADSLQRRNAERSLRIVYSDDECCRIITQGEFAVLLASALGLAEPREGWSETLAASELARLGRSPAGGWELQRPLSERVMQQLLTRSHFAFSPAATPTVGPEGGITWARARAVLRGGMPITQGRFAQMVVQALSAGSARGLDAEQSVALLRKRSVSPSDGWHLDELLTEKAMREILQAIGLALPAQVRRVEEIDELPVDLSRAYAVLFERRNVVTQAMIALLLVKFSGLPTPPGGWTVESAIAELEKFNTRPQYGWTPTAPICQGDLARLMRRAGVVVTPDEGCQLVVSHSPVFSEPRDRWPSSFASLVGRSTTEGVITGPIFSQPTGTGGGVSTPSATGGTRPPTPVPIPPVIVGPAIPSTYTVSPPRPGF